MSIHYLTDIIVLLAAAVIAVPLFQGLKLGAIPGFLVAGVILGPSGFGYFKDVNDIQNMAELGVVLLLFVIGVELRLARFWHMRHHVFGLGGAQVLVTTAVFIPCVIWGFKLPLNVAILVGAALSLSSTAFVLQLISEKKALNTKHGRAAIAVLLMQDLCVVPLLAYTAMLSREQNHLAIDMILAFGESVAILTLVVLGTRYILNPVLNLLAHFASTGIFTPTALLLVLGFASLFEQAGMSLALGAFVAGLLIGDSSFRHQFAGEIEPFRILLLGLFFMSMGMSLDLATLTNSPLFIFIGVGILLATKTLVLYPLARNFNVPPRHAGALSLLLAQSGEFALVVFAVAFNAGLLNGSTFQQLLLMVLISMLLTPALDMLAQRLLLMRQNHSPTTTATPEEKVPVFIAGFGRMGHRIGELLERLQVPYVAIDNNIDVVNGEYAEGRPVFFGDAQKQEVLRAAGADKAPLAIVAIDNLEGAERVVSSLHKAFPELPIFARGHNRSRCKQLRDLGAQFTVSETFEASSEIAREALLLIGLDAHYIDTTMADFTRDYYAGIDRVK